jgi:hypothetical protein
VPEVAGRFDALLRYAGLRLGRRLGTEVTSALTRRDLSDPAQRTQALVNDLTANGAMSGGIRIPGAVGTLHVTADLRAGQVISHVDVEAPREGRPTTRVNWLVRQLKDTPDSIRVEAFTTHARGAGAAELLRTVRADPTVLIKDPTKELRRFRIAQSTPAGTKRGTGRGAFIDSVLNSVDTFYEQVIQNLKPWLPAPPRMRPADNVQPVEPVTPSLVSTALSSQDGADTPPPARALNGLATAVEPAPAPLTRPPPG